MNDQEKMELMVDWLGDQFITAALVLGVFVLLSTVVGVLLAQREYGMLWLMTVVPVTCALYGATPAETQARVWLILAAVFAVLEGWAWRAATFTYRLFTGPSEASPPVAPIPTPVYIPRGERRPPGAP